MATSTFHGLMGMSKMELSRLTLQHKDVKGLMETGKWCKLTQNFLDMPYYGISHDAFDHDANYCIMSLVVMIP